MDDLEMDAFKGPYYTLSDVHTHPRLVPRFPIWEQHGGAIDRSCRNIDDMKDGTQNESAYSVQTHVPADTDRVIMLSVALQRAWPDQGQMGSTSDLNCAYKQETALPSQAHLITVSQYDPAKDVPALSAHLRKSLEADLQA